MENKDQENSVKKNRQSLEADKPTQEKSSLKKGSADEASYYLDGQFELGGIENEKEIPPGSPDRTPVKEPNVKENEKTPKRDPIPPEKKKTRQ
jgi:hypothetical protein